MTRRFKTALVTGGAGFIGSHVTDALIERRCRVCVVDDLSGGRRRNVHPDARFVRMSVTNRAFPGLVRSVRPEVIFHFAAQKDVRVSIADPAADARVNVLGSIAVIQGASQAGTRKIVFASTGGAMYPDRKRPPWKETVAPEPISPYAVAKRAVEMYLDFARTTHGMGTVALRFANVYGPRQDGSGEAGVVAIFAERLLQGRQPVINGTGRQTRDYVYVDDVVRACLLAMDAPESGVFNVGTGRQTGLLTLFRRLRKSTGSDCREKHGPAKPGEVMVSAVDSTLAARVLGWRPQVSLDEGLRRTVAWFRTRT